LNILKLSYDKKVQEPKLSCARVTVMSVHLVVCCCCQGRTLRSVGMCIVEWYDIPAQFHENW